MPLHNSGGLDVKVFGEARSLGYGLEKLSGWFAESGLRQYRPHVCILRMSGEVVYRPKNT